jgi:4-amino-4-deoxy-L-arabinose transferase-like glycosyltransferase
MLYGLVFTFLGESVWALRFTAWLFAAATVLAIWFFARRWTTPRTANLAAIIGAIVLSLPNIEGFTANAEIFMGLPLTFAAFMLVRQAQTRWSWTQLFSVGVLIGIATLLKPSGIVMAFTAIAFILMVAPGPRKARLRLCLWLLGGVTLVGVGALIHGWFLGWSDFIYATVTYRLTLQSSATVSMLHHFASFGNMIWNTIALLCLTLVLIAFRTILPVRQTGTRPGQRGRKWRPRVYLISHLRHHRQLAPRETAGLMIQLWSIGAVAGIAMGGDWWSHYLIQIAPPLALWLAWNLEAIARALSRWRRVLFLAIATGLLLIPFAIIVDGPEGMLTQLYGHPGYPAQAKVARYVQDHTNPDDTIYVAFDQAAIYYLSDRKPAYRHLYDQELQALPNSYADIIAIIRSEDRPVYIVSTLHPGPFPDDSRAFWREVGQYYDVETTIDGVPVYRAKAAS